MSDKMPNMDYDADEVIEEFKSKFKWPTKDDVEVVVKPPKLALKLILSAILTVIIACAGYYMTIPAINLKANEFYISLIALVAIYVGVFSVLIGARKKVERMEYVKKKSTVPIVIIGVIVVVMVIGWLAGCTLFRAKDYSELMPVSQSTFAEDFTDISYDEVPQLDARTAQALADQELGSLDEYKSQYVVSSFSTQINFSGNIVNAENGKTVKFEKDHPVRVAYLEYADFFKWMNNTKQGIPAYMLIDVVTQTAYAVDCVEQWGEGMKYSPSELFNEKLVRHLRFQYPTAIMDTPNFELDDTGHPYWITPVLDKTIGLFGGTDVKGAIITDALNGESEYYSIGKIRAGGELNWIDVVYSEDIVIAQYNYFGELSHGFWNSLIFQNDVNVTSDGKGYITLDGDVWVYTGVTSSESDSSNFGFILCNQRTKETRYYKNGGAMESSAQGSAEDAVQNYGYRATFPILLNIDNQPTYFMSFYGDDYTVKGYAYVNLKDKTIVGYCVMEGEYSKKNVCLKKAKDNYESALNKEGIVSEEEIEENANEDAEKETEAQAPEENSDAKSVTGKVTDIKTSVNDGNTVYYLQVDGKYYYIAVNDCMEVLLLEKGDEVTISFSSDKGNFVKATSVTVK